MRNSTVGDAAIAVVRRNTEEVQGNGNWNLYEELFADDFIDHTPQPGTTPDKDGVRVLYKGLRAAFPDFRPEIHWQVAAGDLVTTYKTYHGTHQGEFLGIPATGKKVSFYTVDAIRVVDGKIKRLRHSPRARVAPSDVRERIRGVWRDAIARIVTEPAIDRAGARGVASEVRLADVADRPVLVVRWAPHGRVFATSGRRPS